MRKRLKKIDIDFRDVMIFLGLVGAGSGLTIWFGIGEALTATGSALFFVGLFGAK